MRFTGIPKMVARLDDRAIGTSPPSAWFNLLRHANTTHKWLKETLGRLWSDLPEEGKNQLIDVLHRRSSALERTGSSYFWAEHPEIVKALSHGSLDWADQPVVFTPAITCYEEEVALHSIRVPYKIRGWSLTTFSLRQFELQEFFGGVRLDGRGPLAPRPAAHRLFIQKSEAEDFRQRYLHAALLHAVGLVVRHGWTEDWRRWFCELADSAIDLDLNHVNFSRLFGQQVEDACRLAVRVESEIAYISRTQVLELIPGPVYFVAEKDQSQGLLRDDPVNRLLCDVGEIRNDEKVEIDLTNLPIVRARK